jgi:hypothetical protein
MSSMTSIVTSAVLAAAMCMLLSDRRAADGFPGRTDEKGVAYAQTTTGPSTSSDSFLEASKVFLHPRCVNCHPAGDHPLQGDEGRPHDMDVKRGRDGSGLDGLECGSCHESENLPGPDEPPGAPGWHLPPEDMPMVFEKKTARELCLQLKDPAKNGGMSPEQIVEHVRTAPLVLWAWTPGEGRKPTPIPHEEFVKYMAEWARKGAACPE